MRFAWGAALLAVTSAIVIARPDAVGALYQELYPSDAAKRRALDECFAIDPRFDRLDAPAREACYRRMLPSAAAADRLRSGHGGNFVDLWRAAGLGHLPQNDIRFEQQNRR